MGALAVAGNHRRTMLAAGADRLTWWDPAAPTPVPGKYVLLEWRYLAGRITRGSEDYGFVVSLADYNSSAPGSGDRIELLVMREDFTGAGAHTNTTYLGSISYDASTATYSFVGEQAGVNASWKLDNGSAPRYTLSVTTPELTFDQLQITPIGDLIAEGGTGDISSGSFVLNGTPVEALSDYYADWATLSLGGTQVGYGRLDMQTIRPVPVSEKPEPFSHHWFAVAAVLEDGTEAYVSGWELLSGSTAWTVTIATGGGSNWKVASVGSDTATPFDGVQPISVNILEYQPMPTSTPQHTGKRWRFQAGQKAQNDLILLDIAVPEGQFIKGARVSVASDTPMQEALTAQASGFVRGKAIIKTRVAVVESTFARSGPTPAPTIRKLYLPLLGK